MVKKEIQIRPNLLCVSYFSLDKSLSQRNLALASI